MLLFYIGLYVNIIFCFRAIRDHITAPMLLRFQVTTVFYFTSIKKVAEEIYILCLLIPVCSLGVYKT
jgi:hypothetical protein